LSTATVVPLKEYLETCYRPDCEFLEGQLLERNVGEIDHGLLQVLLSNYLFKREEKWGILVLLALRVQVKALRIRVPDIVVITGGRPTTPILVQPPFLCVEVLSPHDRMLEMLERIDDYLNFGVRYVWLIHQSTRRAFVYTRDHVEEVKDGVLKTQNPDIYVPLAEL
jgi:Uma2 family endonuclease